MRRWRTALSGLLLAGLLLTLGAVLAGPAAAETGLPIKAFTSIATDPRTGNVYISSQADNVVVVTDAGGTVMVTLRDLDGATGMLVRDGILYVALWKDQSIAVIDTATLTERQRYPTGAGTCPRGLTATASTIWFSYGCHSSWGLGIGAIRFTPAGATVRLGEQGDMTFLSVPTMAAAPNGPLVAGESGTARAHVFEVTGDRLRLRASTTYEAAGSNLNRVAVSPDGTRAFIASGSPYRVQEASTVDLSVVGGYDTGSSPSSLTLTPSGQFLAAGMHSSSDVDVAVFTRDSPSPIAVVDFGTQGGWDQPNRMAYGGLAWSGDGERLYAVTVNTYDELPTLRVLYPLG